MKIIYMTPVNTAGVFFENNISVSTATSEWTGTIEELAQHIVPTGEKYKIVEDSEVSSDRSFRDAWEYDFTTDYDGVGS